MGQARFGEGAGGAAVEVCGKQGEQHVLLAEPVVTESDRFLTGFVQDAPPSAHARHRPMLAVGVSAGPLSV